MVILALTAALMVLSGGAVWLAGLRSPTARGAPRLSSGRIRSLVVRHPRLAGLARTQPDPRGATGVALSAAFVIVVVGVGCFGVLLVVVRENLGFARADLGVADFAARYASPVSTSVLRALSQLGAAPALVALCVLVFALQFRRGRPLAVVAFLVLCVAGQLVVVDLVKGLVERARPNVDRLAGFNGSSFPSGHTTAAAASFAAFALLVGIGRSPKVRAGLAGLAVAIAVGVGCTRAFLGVHWLSDVLAGLALGWAWFAICSIAFGGRLLRFGEPVERAELAATSVEPRQPEGTDRGARATAGQRPAAERRHGHRRRSGTVAE